MGEEAGAGPPSQSGGWLVLGSRRWGASVRTGHWVPKPLPALLLVVGPGAERTEDRCSLETRASGDGFSPSLPTLEGLLNSADRGRITLHLSQPVVIDLLYQDHHLHQR